MILTVFRARLRLEAADEYFETAQRISAIAKTMPGYISHKLFVAEDGERLTLVEFESAEALKAWSTHADHVQAKVLGRENFYASYRFQVCTVDRDRSFPLVAATSAES